MKCIVRTCPNDSKDGRMEGPICGPCAGALKGQDSGNTPAVRRIVASALNIQVGEVTQK